MWDIDGRWRDKANVLSYMFFLPSLHVIIDMTKTNASKFNEEMV